MNNQMESGKRLLQQLRGRKIHLVHLGKIQCARPPEILNCPALGSCIGLYIGAPRHSIGFLAHVVLPFMDYSQVHLGFEGKYANTAVFKIVKSPKDYGIRHGHLQAKLVGGASLVEFENPDLDTANTGVRNIKACRKYLSQVQVPINGEVVGGNHSFSMWVFVESGKILVRKGGAWGEIKVI